jgi:hypothetical protein
LVGRPEEGAHKTHEHDDNSDPSLSRSTVNGHKYTEGADTVRLAEVNGLPVAFRSVKVATAGSFATTQVQGVTAGGVTPLSTARAEELLEATTPLN